MKKTEYSFGASSGRVTITLVPGKTEFATTEMKIKDGFALEIEAFLLKPKSRRRMSCLLISYDANDARSLNTAEGGNAQFFSIHEHF